MRRIETLLTVALAASLSVAGVAFGQSIGSEFRTGTAAQLARKYREASTYHERAKVSFGKRDHAETRKHLEASLGIFPEFGDSHLLMAKILYTEGDYPKALAEILQAKAGCEKTAIMWEKIELERTTELRKRRKGAEQTQVDLMRQQSIFQPSSWSRAMGELDHLLGDVPLVTPYYGRIPAEYSFLHANVLLRLQRHAEAVEQYDAALKSDPTYAEAANNLASLYYETQEYEAAMMVVTKADARGVSLNPELVKAIEGALRQPK